MKGKKFNLKAIPLKNYLIALGIVILVTFGSLYIFKWIEVYNEKKVATSYLMDNKVLVYEIKELSEIEAALSETPSDYFVFVTYNKNEDTFELEKELEPVITDYNLQQYIYYVNVTDMMDDDNYLDKINKSLGLDKGTIEKVPSILYFTDGELAVDGIVEREDELMINAGDFEKLLEIKGIQKK